MFCLIDEWKEGDQCSVRLRRGVKENNVLLDWRVERRRTMFCLVEEWREGEQCSVRLSSGEENSVL